MKKPHGALQDRFWAKVDKDGPIPAHRPEIGNCWVWAAALHNGGYGIIGLGGRKDGVARAHILSWQWANGREVPAGLFVLHACDNRRCVRPDHLSVGTPKANHDDMVAKRRHVYPPRHVGARNPRARLLEYRGVTRLLGEWARAVGVKRETVAYRLKSGWTLGRALGLEP